MRGERTVRVSIPAGAKTGTKVRLAGEGEAGAQPGDLYLILEVEPDSRFERDGDNLTVDVKVDMFTALLGGEAEVVCELAYRLYSLCERKKRAAEAVAYNGLVHSFPEVIRLAREGERLDQP